MPEADAIEQSLSHGPMTVDSLTTDLASLGVERDQTLIVHTAMSQLGWIAGGPIAIVDALRKTIGSGGTIVMPTHTATLTDPRNWFNPPVPEAWWATIRDQMPAFHPTRTPSTHMGIVAETFRTLPGVVRSSHPVGSFAAQGPKAEAIVADHPLGEVFGDASPLGRLYESRASVLLLGVGHENNTSLHLAESRARDVWREQGSPVLRDGERVWATYRERGHDSDCFPQIGKDYAAAGGAERRGRIGIGEGLLVPVRELVDFATCWIRDRSGASS